VRPSAYVRTGNAQLFSLSLHFSGKGRFKPFDDKEVEHEYQPEAGNGFMIWPMQHTFYMAAGTNPWAYAWVEFNGFNVRELVSQAGLTCNYPILKQGRQRTGTNEEWGGDPQSMIPNYLYYN
jgi:hypothetical protein